MQVSVDTLVNTDGSIKTSSSSSTSSSDKSSDKLDFFNLLCTQLKNQDPMNPQDSSEMSAQLAQFSTLEAVQDVKTAIDNQTTAFNSAVTALSTSALSTTNATAVSLIGKTVRIQQNSIEYAGTDVNFKVHLGNNDSATVTLLNDDGDVVKTFSATDKDENNDATLTWDGIADNGTTASSTSYTIAIENQDTDSSLYSFVSGSVTGVLFNSTSGPVVKIDGKEMSIADILEVSG